MSAPQPAADTGKTVTGAPPNPASDIPGPDTNPAPPPAPPAAPPEGAPGYNSILTKLEEDPHMDASRRAQALIQAQRAATLTASTEEGRIEVLEDSQRYLAQGKAEWAAMLQTAAEYAPAATEAAQRANQNGETRSRRNRPKTSTRKASLPEDSFPERMAKVRDAARTVSQWEDYYQTLQLRAGGAYQDGTCNPCRHPAHPGQRCGCGCGTYTTPTPGQVEAYEAWTNLHNAKQEWDKHIADARKPHPGDRFKVKAGQKVAPGTAGKLVRTHPGNWGEERALLSVDGTREQVWVSVKYLTRDTPGFEPGIGDPIIEKGK